MLKFTNRKKSQAALKITIIDVRDGHEVTTFKSDSFTITPDNSYLFRCEGKTIYETSGRYEAPCFKSLGKMNKAYYDYVTAKKK